jgi:hypothetical protein
MTAWTIAHRLGHSVARERIFREYLNKVMDRQFLEIIRNVYGVNKISSSRSYVADYEPELKAFASAIGTMNSARSNKLRIYNEFHFETVAQWIITGKVKFNPLPRKILLKSARAWGNDSSQYLYARVKDEELTEYNEMLQNTAEELEYNLSSIFGSIVNKIFVM